MNTNSTDNTVLKKQFYMRFLVSATAAKVRLTNKLTDYLHEVEKQKHDKTKDHFSLVHEEGLLRALLTSLNEFHDEALQDGDYEETSNKMIDNLLLGKEL